MSVQQLAEKFSVTALVNALLREWQNYEVRDNEVVFFNSNNKFLGIVLERFSNVGCHAFSGTFFRTTGMEKEFLSFELFVQELFQMIGMHKKMHVLYPRIMESSRNLAAILDYRYSSFTELLGRPSWNFIEAEQALLLGHNVHPCPKSKSEFTQNDHRLFAPEFCNAFLLKWVLLKKEFISENFSGYFDDFEWHYDLYKRDHANPIREGYVPFPFHPWQFDKLSQNEALKELIQNENLIPAESEGKQLWKATSSLRTIYCEESKYMLKFSLSLRITNSIRHLQSEEVVRGLQVHEAMNSQNGQQFLAKHPNFKILNEPSFLAIKSPLKPMHLETIVLIRENPFMTGVKQEAVVLSTITQAGPYLTDGFFSSRHIDALNWFSLYLEKVLGPFILAHADHGILFGAHQQNIIVQLVDSYPSGVIFRDCQGTGYTWLGYEKMKNEVASLDLHNGNVLDDCMAHALLGYYLIINSTFSLINTLSVQCKCSEEMLLRMLSQYLLDTKDCDLLDSTFIDYLLSSSELKQKGNFFCCLNGLNENTEKNPLDIYNTIKNPLYDI